MLVGEVIGKARTRHTATDELGEELVASGPSLKHDPLV
jgi:hypothetical protein